jgi:hypothetical protein
MIVPSLGYRDDDPLTVLLPEHSECDMPVIGERGEGHSTPSSKLVCVLEGRVSHRSDKPVREAKNVADTISLGELRSPLGDKRFDLNPNRVGQRRRRDGECLPIEFLRIGRRPQVDVLRLVDQNDRGRVPGRGSEANPTQMPYRDAPRRRGEVVELQGSDRANGRRP